MAFEALANYSQVIPKEEDAHDVLNDQRGLDKDGKMISYTYNADRVVGNGSFGVVFAATVAETGNIVAIKKVL